MGRKPGGFWGFVLGYKRRLTREETAVASDAWAAAKKDEEKKKKHSEPGFCLTRPKKLRAE